MALSREEMVEILEGIAREGSDTARIAAIRLLIRLEEGGGVDDDEFESLIRRK